MTDFTHHTPRLLSDADAAADLAGLPRAVSGEDALIERLNDECDLCNNEGAEDIATLLAEAIGGIRTLVSERDALAGRVAELEADARRYEWLKERLLGVDFACGDPATCVWVFETDAPISADLDESIDAALSATTPESKP